MARRRFPWLPVLGGLVFLGIILAAGGFLFAANQETHDAFCASCHTQPESVFFQRSTAVQAVDLASYHTTQNTACINCHSGPGIMGRVQAELMGARNAVKWYTGTAIQPAKLTFPIGDANCVKCHPDVTQRGYQPQQQIAVPGRRGGFGEGEGEGEEEGGRNHWHVQLARWQSTSGNAGQCVDCHQGHNNNTTAQSGFMDAQAVQQTCDACHHVLRREE